MPASKALKAASTPSEPGDSADVVAAFLAGAAAFSVCGGVGLARFVFALRGRSVVVEEFEF